ncbi:nitrate assimilation regulatory nira [Fusarium longipes]|uniref:Nitrate assimilation regulatory nira n=1 Tax=Fusarium longipes TaxID=694270 RepID=A0A395RV88_9HYPO|nr:nitrate assimilation regulatory nira [Fusarium longipes]
MLQHLRDNPDLPTVISSLQGTINLSTQPSSLRAARAVALPTGSGTEFELVAQFNTAYPRIPPPDIPALRGLLRQDTDSEITLALNHIPGLLSSASQRSRQFTTPFESGQYCDNRLERLQIGYWSKVPISNEDAASLISFYLQTDHKIMGFFDADLFLGDLVDCRQRFCSSFLVSAVLCFSVQSYAAIKPQPHEVRRLAFEQAEVLWQAEQSDPSLISLAAMCLLSAACLNEGKEALGQELASSLRRHSEQLGLCGNSADSMNTGSLRLDSSEWVRATSQIAWGVYGMLTIHVIFYQNKPIRFPPTLRIPGGDENSSGSGSSPPYLGSTFASMCRIWTILQEVLSVYCFPSSTPISERVPLAFAEGKYQKLLEWARSLPSSMMRTDDCKSDVMIFHMMLHVAVTTIFRPFIATPKSTRLMSLTSADSHPKAVYAASINQLKDLVFGYRIRYPESLFTSFFNPGLFTLSLALLEDLRDPLWQYYFYLCVRCWQDLYICYPIFRDVAKAFLSMAMQKDAIAAREAQKLLRGVEQSGGHHPTAAEAFTSFIFDPVSEKINEAQVHTMADRFDELVVLDELIEKDAALV